MKLTVEQAEKMIKESGGYLDLYNTPITSLPDNLTVGDSLFLGNTRITDKDEELRKVKSLKNGDYAEGKYLYADGILTHIKNKKTVTGYTIYVGKIKGQNVVCDGKNYAHCNKIRDGIADLLFKSAADRGANQYKGLSLDTEMTVKELVTMYRIITGACRQGSESFVSSLGELKPKYTIREALDITQGQYGSDKFQKFFNEN